MNEKQPAPKDMQLTVENLRQSLGPGIAIVLVGSAARGVWSAASDIDLVILGVERPKIPNAFPGYHIQSSSEREFNHSLIAGEDFAAWCVRYGRVLHDDGNWARVKDSSASATWPKPSIKVTHGARRLFMATRLLETGDESAAAEEMVYALGHAARGILLKAGVFPLSRPELAEQVRDAGYSHLADIHERLRNSDSTTQHLLELAQRYAKKLFCGLDADVYRACARDFRQREQTKNARRSR